MPLPLQNERKPDAKGRIVEIWTVRDGQQWIAFCPDIAQVCARSAVKQNAIALAVHDLMRTANEAAARKERIPWTPRTRPMPLGAELLKMEIYTHEQFTS